MPRRFRVGPVAAACALLLGARAAGAVPEPRCKSFGPCRLPDTLDVLLHPGGPDLVVAANFGLLFPAPGGGWQFVCEESFGGRLPERMQLDDRGRVLVPSLEGLYVGEEGCRWGRVAGPLGATAVWDLVFDPQDRQRVWALGGDPRVLYLSTDGGASFGARHGFPEALRLVRMAVAPSDPRTLYVAGYRTRVPLVLAVSTDGGERFTVDEDFMTAFGPGAQTVDFLGVAPDDPQTVYLAVAHASGDQIWRSNQRGRSPVKILNLEDGAEARGLAFGADPATLYVAARETIETPGKPPARLYVSRDGGRTWQDRPSPAGGPRFRCLRYRDGALYACAGDRPNGDSFLLGRSRDEGQTWEPVVRLADVRGAPACVAATCATTAVWLCEAYGLCGPGGLPEPGRPPGPADGSADAAADAMPPAGCGCTLGGRPGPGAAGLLLLLAAALGRRRGP